MVVHGLIFKELLKRGYSRKGKKKVWNIADSKLWYLTPKQAQAYLDLENSKEYDALSNSEFNLVEGNEDIISKAIGSDPVNIIDLGCGDGKKAAHIMGHLNGKVKMRYCPIDISGYMVQKASEVIGKLDLGEIIEFQFNISDFENLENLIPLLHKGEFKKNVFLLLGYTLGNFEINQLLYEIRSSMGKGDVFIAIDGLTNSKWEKRAESSKHHANTKKFFGQIPLLLGFDKKDFEFGGRFENSRIEFYCKILSDKVIDFNGKEIKFNKDDEIIVAVAYKHEKDELLTILNMHFDDVNVKVSKDDSTALLICKR